MKRKDIANALKAHLASGSIGPDVAWPNVSDDGERPYLQVQWPVVRREGRFIKGSYAEEIGRMSVTVVTEIGIGEDQAHDFADAISDLFPEHLRINFTNGQITISGPCDISGGFRDGPDYRVPVTVKYIARPA